MKLVGTFDHPVGPGDLYYIPLYGLFFQRSFESAFNDCAQIHGLVIMPTGDEMGSYRRCGHAVLFGRVDSPFTGLASYFAGIQAAREGRQTMCEMFDPAMGHLIKLI